MTYENKCPGCGRFEWRAARYATPDPACPGCGGPTERLISAPAVVWAKPLVEYGNPYAETAKKDSALGGHWMYRKNSGRALETGVPEKVFIRTESEQRRFCRDEGLIPPSDMPGNISVAGDGESLQTTNRSEV